MAAMKDNSTGNDLVTPEKMEDGGIDGETKVDPDTAIREILRESDDGYPVRALNVDEEKEEPVVILAGGVGQDEEIIHCYSHPTAKTYSSHWRKQIFGLEDWTLVNYDALPLWQKDNDYIITGNRYATVVYSSFFVCILAIALMRTCAYARARSPRVQTTRKHAHHATSLHM